MRKVLIVTTIQNTVEAFLIPHIKNLEKKGYKVSIATKLNEKLPESLQECNLINIPFGRIPLSKNSFYSFIKLKKIMENEKFDFVWCHTPIASFLTRIAGLRTNQKIVYMAHGFHFYKGASIINWMLYYPMEWIAAKFTDKIITINKEDYENALMLNSKRAKVYKIDGIGIDLDLYKKGNRTKVRTELELNFNEKIITIIGELNKNKNQIQIIKAIEFLKNREIEVKCLIVGVGDKELELKDYVKKNKLEENIVFLGYRKDVADIIAASDILVSTSYREGLPRNIMEGMAQGKPFIATNIRGNRDIITDGINGYLIKINDYEELSRKIELLYDEEKTKRIYFENLKSIKKYSLYNIEEQLNTIFKN